jgi:hypothetical protein
MMNIDANVDDLNDYVGNIRTSLSLETLAYHQGISSLTMSNFNAYRNSLKKFQCWPHSLLTVRASMDDIGDGRVGRRSMKFQESSEKSLNPLTPNIALTLKSLIPIP